jgi:hypothetical protein
LNIGHDSSSLGTSENGNVARETDTQKRFAYRIPASVTRLFLLVKGCNRIAD